MAAHYHQQHFRFQILSFFSISLLFSLIHHSSMAAPLEMKLNVKVVGWRHLPAYQHLLGPFMAPGRFFVVLHKRRCNDQFEELDHGLWTGHYDVASFSLPREWEEEMMAAEDNKVKLTGEKNNKFRLDITAAARSNFPNTQQQQFGHKITLPFSLTLRNNLFQVTMSEQPGQERIDEQPFNPFDFDRPLRHILFNVLRPTNLLLKEIRCLGNPSWSTGHMPLGGQKLVLQKFSNVCQGDRYQLRYAHICEHGFEVGVKEPYELVCDEAVFGQGEDDEVNLYNIEEITTKEGGGERPTFKCSLDTSFWVGPEVLQYDQELDDKSWLTMRKERLMDPADNTAKRRFLFPIAKSNGKEEEKQETAFGRGT